MIESKNDASRNLEKALQALEQAKQRVANEKKKQNEKKRKAENHHKRKADPTFYPVVYGAADDADRTSEEVWYRANPSLGHTIDIGKVRNACLSVRDNPAEENIFRQLRLNQWAKQATRWMQIEKWDACAFPVDEGEHLGA